MAALPSAATVDAAIATVVAIAVDQTAAGRGREIAQAAKAALRGARVAVVAVGAGGALHRLLVNTAELHATADRGAAGVDAIAVAIATSRVGRVWIVVFGVSALAAQALINRATIVVITVFCRCARTIGVRNHRVHTEVTDADVAGTAVLIVALGVDFATSARTCCGIDAFASRALVLGARVAVVAIAGSGATFLCGSSVFGWARVAAAAAVLALGRGGGAGITGFAGTSQHHAFALHARRALAFETCRATLRGCADMVDAGRTGRAIAVDRTSGRRGDVVGHRGATTG